MTSYASIPKSSTPSIGEPTPTKDSPSLGSSSSEAGSIAHHRMNRIDFSRAVTPSAAVGAEPIQMTRTRSRGRPLERGPETFEEKYLANLLSLRPGIREYKTSDDRGGGYSTSHTFEDSNHQDAYEVHVHRDAHGGARRVNVKRAGIAMSRGATEATIRPEDLDAWGIDRFHTPTRRW